MIEQRSDDLRTRFLGYYDPSLPIKLHRKTIFSMLLPQTFHEFAVAVMSLLSDCAHPPQTNLVHTHVLDERSNIRKHGSEIGFGLKLGKVVRVGRLITKNGFEVFLVEDQKLLPHDEEVDGLLKIKAGAVIQIEPVLHKENRAGRYRIFCLPSARGVPHRIENRIIVDQFDQIEGRILQTLCVLHPPRFNLSGYRVKEENRIRLLFRNQERAGFMILYQKIVGNGLLNAIPYIGYGFFQGCVQAVRRLDPMAGVPWRGVTGAAWTFEYPQLDRSRFEIECLEVIQYWHASTLPLERGWHAE
jgi:hypothetical protein